MLNLLPLLLAIPSQQSAVGLLYVENFPLYFLDGCVSICVDTCVTCGVNRLS